MKTRMLFTLAVLLTMGSFIATGSAQTPDGPVVDAPVVSAPAPKEEKAPPAPAPTPAKKSPHDGAEAANLVKLTERLQFCTDMKDRAIRLRCYDDEATKLGLMQEEDNASERQRIETYGFWQVLSEKDQIGIETLYLTISPYNEMAAAVLQAKNPTLSIRCRQGATDVYLDWKSVLNGRRGTVKELQVFTKIDNNPDQTEWWTLSVDGFAAFSPDPVATVNRMRNKDKLILRLTPVDYNTETLAFEIRDLEKALDIMVKRCYKK